MSKTKKYVKKSLRKTNKKIRKKISNKHRKKHHKKSIKKYSKKRTRRIKKKGGERALGRFFGVKSRCKFDHLPNDKESLNALYELCKKKSRTNEKGRRQGCQNPDKESILNCKSICCANPFFFFENDAEKEEYKQYSDGDGYFNQYYSGKFDGK